VALIQKVKKGEWTWKDFFKSWNENDFVSETKIEEENLRDKRKKERDQEEKRKKEEKKRVKHKYDDEEEEKEN